MQTSEAVSQIAKALAAAQGEMRNPEATEKVEVQMKAGGKYSYSYAPFPKCLDAARAALSKHGIAHSSSTELMPEGILLKVRLTHESGEWYEAEMPLAPGLDSKSRAGEITFWKRYLFNGLVGISGDDDPKSDDGERGPANSPGKPAQQRPPAKAPRAAPAQDQAKGAFDTDKPPRLRGEIVKEILALAGKLGMAGPGIDPMPELSKLGFNLFHKNLQDLNEGQLEAMLAKMSEDLRGK